jgi:hypothetical protein
MADNKKRLEEINALLKEGTVNAEERAKLTKEENYLLKEQVKIQSESLDLSSSAVDSIKELLGYSTKKSTSDANLLKVNKEINKTILNQQKGLASIETINKRIAKNHKSLNKSKVLEKSLEKLIGEEKMENVNVAREQADLLSQIQSELDNELKLLAEGKLENLDNVKYLQKSLKFHDAIFDSQMRGLESEQQQLLFTQLNSKELEKQNAERAKELKLAKEIEEKLGVAGKLNKLLGAIPGIGNSASKALAEVTKELERAADAGEELPSKAKIAGMQFKALGKNLVKDLLDPTTLAVGAMAMFGKALMSADKEAGELAKEMGVSYQESLALGNEMTKTALASEDILVNRKNLIGAQKSLNEYFGTGAKFSGEIAEEFASIQERTGLSNKAMGFFTKTAMKNGKTTKGVLLDIKNTTLELNKQNKTLVSVKEVQEGVAKLSNTFRLRTKGGVEELAKAVIESKALGINMEHASAMSSSLLDFESSIQNELQAELLLGQDINLESARALALQGDKIGAAKEVLKNQSIMKAFETDNVIAQEAAAKAAGLTVDQLADVVTEQQNLKILQDQYGEGVESMSDAQKEYNDKRAAGMSAEEAAKEINNENLSNQLESASVAAKMEGIVTRIQDVFMSMAEPILGIVEGITNMVGGAENFASILVGISATYLIIKGAMMASRALQAGQLAYETAKAAIMGTQAVAATTTNAMATFGIGTVIAIAAVAAGLASLATYGFMKDGVIGPGGEMVVSGPKGSIQLDKDDSIIAGTNLGGKGKGKDKSKDNIKDNSGGNTNNIDIQPIVAAINAQNSILNKIVSKSTVIEMGGNEVGQGINTAEREIQ